MPVCGCCKRSLKKPVRTNKSEPKFLDSVEKAYQHYHFILNAKLQFTDLLHISYYITEHNNSSIELKKLKLMALYNITDIKKQT